MLDLHLASHSPWRRKHSPALAIRRRENMKTVVVDGSPRFGPFRLEQRPRAIALARAAMTRALASSATAVMQF